MLIRFSSLILAVACTILPLSQSCAVENAQCSGKQVSTATSPNNIWTADVEEDVCSDGWFNTVATFVVKINKFSSVTDSDNEVLVTDDHGHPFEQPILAWISDNKVQITVPNNTTIARQKERFEDVEVSVRFDPDDPIAREKFLKSLESNVPK